MLKHALVLTQSDGENTDECQPSDWNAEHLFDGGALGGLLYRDTGQSTGASWLTAAAGVPYWSGAGVAPTVTTAPTLLGTNFSAIPETAIADGALLARVAAAEAISAAWSFAGIANTGLKVLDTDASHALAIVPGSNLTAARTLTLATGDADRTITLSGSPTLSDWFDQPVKVAASPTFVAVSVSTTALGTTATDGVSLINTTAAAAGAQQVSPRVRWRGNGWNSGGSATNTIEFDAYVLPVQDATNMLSSFWKLRRSDNGAAFADVLAVRGDGVLTTGSYIITKNAIYSSDSNFSFGSLGNNHWQVDSAGNLLPIGNRNIGDGVGSSPDTVYVETAIVNSGYSEFTEIADPAAGASNTARLYAKDNGSGKTQLVVRFPTGAVQVLATEP